MAGGIARGDVRLYSFASPDKKRPVVVLTRDSSIAYLSTVSVAAHNLHYPRCAVGGCLGRGRWYEGALCGEPAQYDHGLSGRVGAARGPAEFRPHEGNLRCIALFSGLRSQSTLEQAALYRLASATGGCCASPGLSVRGSGFSNPRERFIWQWPGF